MLHSIIVGAYLTILTLLAIYGAHRLSLVFLFLKNRKRDRQPVAHYAEKDMPVVTVQLPMFNERNVAARLIEACAQIEYPRDKLEIQVLDDSTDETVDIARAKVNELAAQGMDIVYIHRTDRQGYKAGALELGLQQAKGELILVFDADFKPDRQILQRTVHFFNDAKVGMVQARWGHINRDYSLLTRIEALMLDGHFVIEQEARSRTGRFFNFNGTAGVWRKEAIMNSGGWEHDTLTEDMDLSYRAQLNGWQFVYLRDVVAPAEIPVEMNAFKSQQHRWAKGSVQVAKKMLPTVMKSSLPWRVKVEAFFHLTNNFAYLLMVPLSLLLLPCLMLRPHGSLREVLMVDLPLFACTTVSLGAFYITAYCCSGRGGLWSAFTRVPLLMSLGIGLTLNQARAVVEGLIGYQTEFVRTPKHGVEKRTESWIARQYRGAKGVVPLFEFLFAIYFVVAIVVAVGGHHWAALPFLVLFLLGFLYVASLSVYQTR
jgi:cellulose synthase/poly-beta-1,6-N-acetylglucosamine synthase-like glycosyltransferase